MAHRIVTLEQENERLREVVRTAYAQLHSERDASTIPGAEAAANTLADYLSRPKGER